MLVFILYQSNNQKEMKFDYKNSGWPGVGCHAVHYISGLIYVSGKELEETQVSDHSYIVT